ncbi:energy transducer TonB [Bordetella genomosp. 9]|uniref:Energy transducer TonB n=1 Tax=Bordetella genomosp. 9 TaxID=1416803 RepID=A0A261R6J9_9BORD|nr:TonB family protein [Bordetella genomosp. 9]OZI20581.1 energy transducer TonB [Bordetella genomosp. 9]
MGARAQHHLWLALAISLIVHAAVLAVRFAPPRTPRPPAQSLEIILVNAKTDTAPVKAEARAQANVEGGGDAEKGMAQSPLPQSGEAPSAVVLEAMRKRQASLEETQQRLLSQLQASTQVSPPRQSGEPVPDASTPGREDQDQDSVLQNAQVAALAARVQAYNKRPRRTFVAPSAEASRYAQYLDAWRSRIEAVGTQNYPEEARGKLYGTLRMTVYVRADGSVADVEIDTPSQYPVLNQAARRIVQLAAPFAPFPPDIARDTDVLAITRTWNFVNDTLETRAP